MADVESDDFTDSRVPRALYWTTEQVANWIVEIGFPYYRSCITSNFITGRQLIKLDASALVKIGICDFTHVKFIAKSIRDLLTVEPTVWHHPIALQPRNDLGMYLETKSYDGAYRDKLTYSKFLEKGEKLWKPPLTNVGFSVGLPNAENHNQPKLKKLAGLYTR